MAREFTIGKSAYSAHKVETGRYDIHLQGTGRVGEVTGCAGNWAAYCHGQRLTCYASVHDAVQGIDNDLKQRKR